ncbi:hypothetical protein ACS0TY_017801 [Phlomoides rotata]
MVRYLELVAKLCEQFHQVYIEQVPCEQNSQGDTLSKLATSEGATDLSNISLTKLVVSFLEQRTVAIINVEEESWTTLIILYLKTGALPEDRVRARQLQL